nr:hypothetical protein [Candidatus Freyarchaeota archaeon]
MGVYRPSGVTALAIIFIILAVAGIIAGIALEAIFVPMYQNMIISNEINDFVSFFILYNTYPFPIEMSFLLLASMFTSMISLMTTMLPLINILHWAVVAALISSVAYFIASFGLLSMKKWGYYLALILGILSLPSVIGIVIVVYLLVSDIKYEFE